jgi:hypothetical protein
MVKEVFRMALPNRTQGAIDFMGAGRWRLWLHTPDYIHGTYLDMYSDGKIVRVTVREDEGDEVVTLKEAGS